MAASLKWVMRRALDHINDRAVRYTESTASTEDPRAQLEEMLLLEIQDTAEVRNNSVAWGELRASAVFSDDLRESLRTSTRAWSEDAEALIRAAMDVGRARPGVRPADAAERLTALVEGLSERWLSGSLTIERARDLLSGAVTAELGPG